MAEDKNWPAWRYGPGGQSRIFQKDEQIPKGWENHPDKVKEPAVAGESRKKQEKAVVKPEPATPADVPQAEPTAEERASTIRDIREAAAAQNLDIQLSDDASVEEINAAIDKLTKE